MKLVGFGCSFTYGSELVDLKVGTEFHRGNTPYREQSVWLGQLAKLFDCGYDNRAEPACSNYAISQLFYDWFQSRDIQEKCVVCVGWTEPDRMRWWDDGWVHSGFISNDVEKRFRRSFKDWIAHPNRNNNLTNQAKLFVNSVCQINNIDIIQFDALPNTVENNYSNYFCKGLSMQQVLLKEEELREETYFAEGGHPNEQGHKWFAKRLRKFARLQV